MAVWAGAWSIFNAIWPHSLRDFNILASLFIAVLMQHDILYWHLRSYFMALLQFYSIPPLQMFGLLLDVVLCSWVNPRTHCAQERGVDSHLELLVFQSPTSIFICRLSSYFFRSPSSVITLPLPVSPGLQTFVASIVPFVLISMPILCQRVGCRRGGSHG